MAKETHKAQGAGSQKPVPPRHGPAPAVLKQAWSNQTSGKSELTNMTVAKKKVR